MTIRSAHTALFSRSRRLAAIVAVGIATASVLSACAPPGASTAPVDSAPASTDLGTEEITLDIVTDTPGVDALKEHGEGFMKLHPNVTVKVTGQDFNTLITNAPRLLASGDVPDLVRLASFGNLVKDKLISPLDDYAEAYGWDQWPQSQFASLRSNEEGTVRGKGKLYGAGPGYGLTGVYYNKAILDELGGALPTTLDEFEALLQQAHAAGYTGLLTQGKDGGLTYPLQNLIMNFGGAEPVQAWNFNEPGATIDTSATVEAAATLQSWSDRGLINADTNSVDFTSAPVEFQKGRSLFWASGNWSAPGADNAMPGNVGFFLFPSMNATDPRYGMSASYILSVPSKSDQKDAAAAFLDYVQTDPGARQVTFDQIGLLPAGPEDAPALTAAPGAQADTLTQFAEAFASNGLVEFMANATASMSVSTLIPQTQLLVTGKVTPEAFAAKVQADYEASLGGR